MITVEEAERIVLSTIKDFGTQYIPFEQATGRVLAKKLIADRDIPPFNRATMDGIAIKYAAFKNGNHLYKIRGIQAAGDEPINNINIDDCIEIMTGAALHPTFDTVVRYEDLDINSGIARIKCDTLYKGQNIHKQGTDKKKGAMIVSANTVIDPLIIATAASIGAINLLVKKVPKILIISTGNELTEPGEMPLPYQIRKSNVFALKALLEEYKIDADHLHLTDERAQIKNQLSLSLEQYDVLLISGGVSAGKFDFLPEILSDLSVQRLFHKVAQRPGKPFWFGKKVDGPIVFALPGNPLSTYLCAIRYFVPWLQSCLGIYSKALCTAILEEDILFPSPLHYFIPVSVIINDKSQLLAKPIHGNGSGDYLQVILANAFIELPMHKERFNKGESYRIWPFKHLLIT
jgi:molybdopterin molybdotransferase